MAGMLCRHARNAELSAQASSQAEELFGGDSLVVADLRYSECCSLNNLASKANGAEEEALSLRSWAVLLSVVNLLLRRLDANTLLPGTIREEELDYEAHARAATCKAKNVPVPSPDELRALASTMGYNTLLETMFTCLDLLQQPLWPTVQKRMVESLVLRGLEVIPRTAGIPADAIIGEGGLVTIIKEDLTPRKYGSAFCTAVIRKWRSNAVSSVLRARGVLQTGIVKSEQSIAEFQARKRANIAVPGCATAPSPPVPRRRRRSKSSASAPGAARRCTAAWNTRRWTGRRTKRRAKRRRRRGGLKRRRTMKRRAVGLRRRE